MTGSIAAYKIPILVRLLVKEGAEVRVIMTPAAKDFVSPLTLSTLSKNPVLTELFDEANWANHVMLGRWAHLMLIAPLSCNTLGKMTHGFCDNLLMATYFSATCPVVVAPAMDEDMWKHPVTKDNLDKLETIGHKLIPVATGELASGLFGEGRMAEPEEIIEYIGKHFFLPKPLSGKKALVTAGPTFEPIDPVRFIGNHSSGKMGIAIAKELHERGAVVKLVLGPTNLDLRAIGFSANGISLTRVNTAGEMMRACEKEFTEADITIMAAAVADYAVSEPAREKIKKKGDSLTLELWKTEDILRKLGEKKKPGQVLVGFALETNNARENALIKLKEKNADLVVLNSLENEGAGFAIDTNRVTIFGRDGEEWKFETKTKKEVAADIVDTLIKKFYA